MAVLMQQLEDHMSQYQEMIWMNYYAMSKIVMMLKMMILYYNKTTTSKFLYSIILIHDILHIQLTINSLLAIESSTYVVQLYVCVYM